MIATASQPADRPAPCTYFQRGACRYGANCKYSHELNAVAPPPQASVSRKSSLPTCTYFLRNACYKGVDCPFNHPAEIPSAASNKFPTGDNGLKAAEGSYQYEKLPTESSIDTTAPRTIAGAGVTYADGATVSDIALAADFSTMVVTKIPLAANAGMLHDTLKEWILHDEIEVLSVKTDQDTSTQSAQVKVADEGRSCRALASIKPDLTIFGSKLEINSTQLSNSDAGTNRLQLSGVTCMWHSPSKTAFLKYGFVDHARRAVSTFSSSLLTLHGRRPTYEIVRDEFARGRSDVSPTVRVGNLDCRTSVQDMQQHLSRFKPLNIAMGPSSHDKTGEVMEQQVKRSLEKYGRLLEWRISPNSGAAKITAYAKFPTMQEAAQAVKQLDGSQIDPSLKDVLHVQHVFSVKLPVSQRVLKAVRSQLDNLRELSRSTSHVSIKTYENPSKLYTQIRVSGSEKKAVGQAKTKVEALLAGSIARRDDQPLFQPFLFQNASDTFLDDIMKTHGVFILRDRSKVVLRLYGEARSVQAAQEAICVRLEEREKQAKEIILDHETLIAALRGGFQRIVAALGKDKVKLDITSKPKRIIVSGSDKDVDVIHAILRAQGKDFAVEIASLHVTDTDNLCAICWTPAEDPVITTCEHTYCKGCFESQAASTSNFPMCCLGDSGNCNTPMTLPELQRMLGNAMFDKLLESSLTTHIRSHPKQFQYCSTPDCNRFYRISHEREPITFNCDHCLASICTACHQSAHDSETCAEAKASRDGTDEFAAWKRNNDVRDCPTCGTPIQKSEGCNHMTCRSCQAHICWHCMKVFDVGKKVYEHMNMDHGADWGLGWRAQDFE